MANVTLNPGHRYTFAKVDTVPVIIDSTDHAEGMSYFRNDVQITGSVEIQNSADRLLTLTNRQNNHGADVELTFSSSHDARPGAVWTIGVDARTATPFRWNTFVINNDDGFSGTPALVISASNEVFIDYDALPTSDPSFEGQLYKVASGSHHVLCVSAG